MLLTGYKYLLEVDMKKYLADMIERYPQLSVIKEDMLKAFDMIKESFSTQGTLFTCGNGGSASDAEHIVGELMKGFMLKREIGDEKRSELVNSFGDEGKFIADNLQMGMRAVSLTGHPALSTAFANDMESVMTFAQQLFVLGKKGDVLLAISTSGNSDNVIKTLQVSSVNGIKTIALTGKTGGKCVQLADIAIQVPVDGAHYVQELHLPVYHTLCLMLEEHFYGG